MMLFASVYVNQQRNVYKRSGYIGSIVNDDRCQPLWS